MRKQRLISLLAVIAAIVALFYAGTTIGTRPAAEPAGDMPSNVQEVIPAPPIPSPAANSTHSYFPLLGGKKVGVMCNHTALVGDIHLVDTLLASGIEVGVVFAPEHGFRGDADAGEHVKSYKDPKTGIDVISAYGSSRKPDPGVVAGMDVMIFDIQDVGLRFYTYLSSMHYLMESCAEAGVPLVVLDRPNPNGMYVDGPILDPKHRSFIGMHPIPVVHGMTLGELARMINGEGWLGHGLQCDLTVIPCENYSRSSLYELPVKPSPNLPNMRSVYLYPSICFFEATPVSLGRGTDFPFQVYGHPDMEGYPFRFTPEPRDGAKEPLLKGRVCYGVDLRTVPSDREVIAGGVNLAYVIDAYNALGLGNKFFNNAFKRLTGVDYVREMIMGGSTAEEIKAVWQEDVEKFKRQREPYLIYEE
ncbi:MAG: DUF1343 domain-containing protein [Alistipes sp.]|nr:DUF1343 domain-containing protein [Alistipes sp.]